MDDERLKELFGKFGNVNPPYHIYEDCTVLTSFLPSFNVKSLCGTVELWPLSYGAQIPTTDLYSAMKNSTHHLQKA